MPIHSRSNLWRVLAKSADLHVSGLEGGVWNRKNMQTPHFSPSIHALNNRKSAVSLNGGTGPLSVGEPWFSSILDKTHLNQWVVYTEGIFPQNVLSSWVGYKSLVIINDSFEGPVHWIHNPFWRHEAALISFPLGKHHVKWIRLLFLWASQLAAQRRNRNFPGETYVTFSDFSYSPHHWAREHRKHTQQEGRRLFYLH